MRMSPLRWQQSTLPKNWGKGGASCCHKHALLAANARGHCAGTSVRRADERSTLKVYVHCRVSLQAATPIGPAAPHAGQPLHRRANPQPGYMHTCIA